MSLLMDADGRVIDKELNELGIKLQEDFNNLLQIKADWTLEQMIVAAFHLQGYVNTVIMRRIVENVMKNQNFPPGVSSLKLQPPKQ